MQDRLPEINGLHGRYLWKAEWVRPYESVYSIMHNFCTVNVVDGMQAFNLLFNRLRKHNKSFFVENWLCYAQSNMNQYDLLNELTPEWYISEIKQFPIIRYRGVFSGEKYGCEIAFHKRLRVCPLCMKENYHSYFHNIAGAEKCFIHDVPLETQDCMYDISAIICDPDADETFDNAFYGIVPPDRTVNNGAYDKNPVHCSFDTIYPILIPRQEEANPSMWHLLSGDIEPDQIIHVPSYSESVEEFCNSFIKRYADYKIKYSVWDNNPYRADCKPELSAITLDLDILLWTREHYIRMLMGEIPKQEIRKFWDCNELLKTQKLIPCTDLLALKMCFLWAYADTQDPSDALCAHKVLSPQAGCNKGRFCKIGIELSLERFNKSLTSSWRNLFTTIINVKLAVQRDYMQYLFDLFIEYSKNKETIDKNEWMDGLAYPCYYILEKEGEDGYTIYRYNNT